MLSPYVTEGRGTTGKVTEGESGVERGEKEREREIEGRWRTDKAA